MVDTFSGATTRFKYDHLAYSSKYFQYNVASDLYLNIMLQSKYVCLFSVENGTNNQKRPLEKCNKYHITTIHIYFGDR